MAARPRVLVVGRTALVDGLRVFAPEVDLRSTSIEELASLAAIDGPRMVVIVLDERPETGDPARAIEVLRMVRRSPRPVRVLFVNPLDAWLPRIAALEAGVEDALPSIPLDELAARIRLASRGRSSARRTRLPIGGGLELDLERRELWRDGRWTHLRPKEAGLLELLARAPGRAFTRDQILGRVWGNAHRGDPRTVDVHVRWLRGKIEEDPRRPALLVTVRGVGYRLERLPTVNGLLTRH